MNEITEKSRKKWVGYILFGILLTLGLLYYRFPSEAIQGFIQARVEKISPRLALSMERVSPSITLGLKFLEPELFLRTTPQKPIFKADRLFVRPVFLSLFRGEWTFCYNALAYKGVFEGCTSVAKDKNDASFQTTLVLKDVPMGGDNPLKEAIGRNLEGILNGTVTYNGQSKSLIRGTGEVDLRLSEGRMELVEPILNLEGISFHEVLVKMSLSNRKLNLTRVALRGTNMNGTLTGVVNLNKELSRSSLNLRGTLEPFADFIKDLTDSPDTVRLIRQRLKRGKITFVIRGTLAEPNFRFM
jgi:type II secretion system protein N